jgi:hypothetical protein
MNNKELIKEIFNPLTYEYGFSITKDFYNPEFMGNAGVVFVFDKIGIKIVVDRDQVLVNIGTSSEIEEKWFEFEDVIHFYAPQMNGVYLFQRPSTFHNDIDSQLKWILHLMRKYCEPILRGDSTHFDGIKEIERKRVKELIETYKRI